jgi:hypothetical protein
MTVRQSLKKKREFVKKRKSTKTRKITKSIVVIKYYPKGIVNFLKKNYSNDIGQLLKAKSDLFINKFYIQLKLLSEIYEVGYKNITILSISKGLNIKYITKNELIDEMIKKGYQGITQSASISKLDKLLQNYIEESSVLLKYPYINDMPLEYCKYVTNSIQQNMFNTKKYTIKYKCIDSPNSFILSQIEIYYYYNERISQKRLKSMVYKIISYITFFKIYLKRKETPIFKIYFTRDKKLIPDKSKTKVFDIENVNSAVTNSIDIIIFREEELFKSICHECIHLYGLDSHLFNIQVDTKIKNKYRLDTESIRINEAYTDLLANILNIIFISTLQNNISPRQLSKLIYQEMCFTHFQASKIYSFIGCKTYNDFYSNISKNDKNDIILKEKTHVFSYYLLKSKMYFEITELFTLLNNGNKNLNLKLNVSLNEVEKYIEKSINKDYEKMMDYLINILNNYNKNNMNSFMKTMRMSITEFNF